MVPGEDRRGAAVRSPCFGKFACQLLAWARLVAEDAADLDDMVNRACRITQEEKFGNAGERVIIMAGVPLRTPGTTNMLRIAYLGSANGVGPR